MNLNDYQNLATRTAQPHPDELLNYGLGLTGESGEVADLIKKFWFHKHDIDRDDIIKELGDVLWYVSQLSRYVGVTLEEVATANIAKLQKRYPNGFNENDSINREL